MTGSVLDLVLQDELTGLANRRWYNRRLAELEAAPRPLALAVVDLDHFKAINDHYGHLEGDELLRQVSAVYQQHADHGVTAVRYAGDEFLLLMEGHDKPRAVEVANLVCRDVAAQEYRLAEGGPPIRVTNSIGVAHYPSDTQEIKGLFELADRAALQSKRQGRNRVSTCDDAAEVLEKETLYRRFPCPRLVGREATVHTLETLVPPRAVQAPPLVVLEGEPGLGKSRLLRHLLERGDAERTLMLSARGAPSMARQPFGMLCAALNRWAGQDAAAIPLLAEALQPRQIQEIAAFIPSLRMYAPAEATEEGTRKEALLGGFTALLTALASRRGLALLLDDAQHVDWGTLQVLRAFLEAGASGNTLIALSIRPGSDEGPLTSFVSWAREGGHLTHFLLEPLSLDEVVEMVESILPGLDRPLDLATALFERSNGVPLFIEELLKYLVHRDVVRIAGRALQVADFAPEDLPGNVAEAFQGRTEDLDDEVRGVLSTAAVLGAEFNLRHLSQLEGRDEAYVADLLDKAGRANLVREGGDGDTWDFLFQDEQAAFYGTLDEVQRRSLHGRAGEALSSEAADAEVAFHFEQAGERERAMEFGTRLARTYADLAAPDEITAWTKMLPGGKAWGDEAALGDEEMRRAQKLARVLKTSIQNFRIFPAHSEILLDTRDAAYEELRRLLELTESLTFSEAGETGLINGREPVLGAFERNPVADLMGVLARSGLKGISFRHGVGGDEVFRFLELLARRPDEVRREGGWTEMLAREEMRHIVVNERVYVAGSERDLQEGRVGGAPSGDDRALQELVDLIRNEGDALREQLLKSDDFKQRLEEMVRLLKAGGAAPTPRAAARGMSALPPWMRGEALEAPEPDVDFLAGIWEDLLVLFKELESGSRHRVNNATRALLSRGREVVGPLFEFVKSSDDLRARKIAIKLIERHDPLFKSRLLQEIRGAQQSDERLRLISLLDAYNTPDVLASLVRSVYAHDRELRREAMRIVEANGSTQAEALLVKAVESEQEPVKVDAIRALGRLGRAGCVPDLIKVIRPVSVFLDESYVEAQCEACATLGRLREKSAVKALATALRRRLPFPFSLLRTKPSPVRAAAAAALGALDDEQAVRILRRYVKDRDVALRSVVKLVLGGTIAG